MNTTLVGIAPSVTQTLEAPLDLCRSLEVVCVVCPDDPALSLAVPHNFVYSLGLYLLFYCWFCKDKLPTFNKSATNL